MRLAPLLLSNHDLREDVPDADLDFANLFGAPSGIGTQPV
jgi:hypothetical protein